MQYVSTRGSSEKINSSQAILKGIANDGGLYTPISIPELKKDEIEALCSFSYEQKAAFVLSKFLSDFTYDELLDYSQKAYNGEKFDKEERASLVDLGDSSYSLELWHGPTSAFKDMALQMLPYLLTASLKKNNEQKTVCILVATSGDTGKAALEGFCDVEKTKIIVFYPNNGVSQVQKLQMTTQKGKNVSVCAVEGNFDDAQNGVKQIFANNELAKMLNEKNIFLSSANSINWGRLVPQIVYYVSAYCDLIKAKKIKFGDKINVCVPTGNFGNILSAFFAKKMGIPINKFICASNSNNVLTDFINSGIYDKNRKFYTTISPSMDILISSNVERLLYLLSNGDTKKVSELMQNLSQNGKYELADDMKKALNEEFFAGFATEEQTKDTIEKYFKQKNYLIDTHTAVAFNVLESYREKTGDMLPCVVASTASPYKFADSVLCALEQKEYKSELETLKLLAEKTNTQIPAPIKELENASIIFDNTIEKNDMENAVLKFLGE